MFGAKRKDLHARDRQAKISQKTIFHQGYSKAKARFLQKVDIFPIFVVFY